jgi:hypothetical protein
MSKRNKKPRGNIQKDSEGAVQINGDGVTYKQTTFAGPVQAGNLVTGDQTNPGDTTINTPGMTQNNAPANAFPDLTALIEELKQAVESAPAEHAKDANKVLRYATELKAEIDEEDVNTKVAKEKVNYLKEAAENVKDVLPVVVGIGTRIVAEAMKLLA